jgi:hypothetical protein
VNVGVSLDILDAGSSMPLCKASSSHRGIALTHMPAALG